MPKPTDNRDRLGEGAASGVVIIGGANIDIKSRLDAITVVLHTSNPGGTRIVAGGVGRNVAANLAHLGVGTTLITAVGRDMFGERLMAEGAACGIDMSHVVRTEAATGSYTAVLDGAGELVVAVSAMHGMAELTPATLDGARTLIERAAALILDCNVPIATITSALHLARNAGVPTFIDPVSVAKAERLRLVLPSGARIHTVTPNLDELSALVGRSIESDEDLVMASGELHTIGVDNIWVRLGPRGSFISSVHSSVHSGVAAKATPGEFIAARPGRVVDVTGAGDAMLAAYVYAVLQGHGPGAAVRFGHAAAAITVASYETVCSSMSVRTLMDSLGPAPDLQ